MYTTASLIASKLETALTSDQTDYFNNVLDSAIDEYIDWYTGTSFNVSADSSAYASGTGGEYLILPTMSAVTSVEKFAADDTLELVDSDDYVRYPRTGPIQALRHKNGSWEDGVENYKVTGRLGAATVPATIKLAATELAINVLNSNNNNYKSERVGDWSATYSDVEKALTPESMAILDSYRRLARSI